MGRDVEVVGGHPNDWWYVGNNVDWAAKRGKLREDWQIPESRLQKLVDEGVSPEGHVNPIWLLAYYQLYDLQYRYEPFGDGFMFKGCVFRVGSDRSDMYIFNAGTKEQVHKRHEEGEARLSVSRMSSARRTLKTLKPLELRQILKEFA